MRLELYHEQTLKHADYHEAILTEAKKRLMEGLPLSPMEEQGVIRSLQVCVENCIGKAKHLLKLADSRVPVQAYDAFEALHHKGIIGHESLALWKKAIGLRNAVVHDYMELDMDILRNVIALSQYQLMLDFLRKGFSEFKPSI